MLMHLSESVARQIRRPRILVADDQVANVHLIHDLFGDVYDIFMATDGEQAVAHSRAVMPDLILMDIKLPVVDGHEACRRLKADNLTRGIPVIFLATDNGEENEAMAFELGGVDFIAKPLRKSVVRARVSSHLESKLQTDLLNSIALVDGMTGVANRMRFHEELQRDWLLCARNQQPMSLLMIQVDDFQHYSDHYGRQQGEDCLRQVAEIINQTFKRPYDLTARYSGEVFVCLLPDTDANGARLLSQKICDEVRAYGIEHVPSDAGNVVSVSIGLATTFPCHNEPAQVLLKAAERQLYESRRHGRDRVSAFMLE